MTKTIPTTTPEVILGVKKNNLKNSLNFNFGLVKNTAMIRAKGTMINTLPAQ